MFRIAIALVALVSIFIMACDTPPEECLKDLDCTADRTLWRLHAEDACQPLIEGYALYSARWTDEFGESPFDRVAIKPPNYRTVEYSGSAVEFQNGFGAWRQQRYSCEWDPVNEEVLSVDVR